MSLLAEYQAQEEEEEEEVTFRRTHTIPTYFSKPNRTDVLMQADRYTRQDRNTAVGKQYRRIVTSIYRNRLANSRSDGLSQPTSNIPSSL